MNLQSFSPKIDDFIENWPILVHFNCNDSGVQLARRHGLNDT